MEKRIQLQGHPRAAQSLHVGTACSNMERVENRRDPKPIILHCIQLSLLRSIQQCPRQSIQHCRQQSNLLNLRELSLSFTSMYVKCLYILTTIFTNYLDNQIVTYTELNLRK